MISICFASLKTIGLRSLNDLIILIKIKDDVVIVTPQTLYLIIGELGFEVMEIDLPNI